MITDYQTTVADRGTPFYDGRPCISTPDAALQVLQPWAKKTREHFLVACLDGRRKLIGKVFVCSIGTLNSTLVHPREVFREAIKRGSASIIVSHNHPSGDSSPSPEDLALTRRLRDAGRLLGIELADHIIIASGGYVSLRATGDL